MLASFRAALSFRHPRLLRRAGIFQGGGGNKDKKPEETQAATKDDQNKQKQKKPFKDQQQQKNQPQKTFTKQDLKKPKGELEEENFIKSSVDDLFSRIDSAVPEKVAQREIEVTKMDKAIHRKSRLATIRATSDLIEKRTAPVDKDSSEIDLDKLTLQEVILSPMERYKPSVD